MYLLNQAIAQVVSRRVLGLSEAVSRSLAMVCSQKSLVVALAIWSLAFAQAHPGASLPPLLYLISQFLLGGACASWWARRPLV